MYDDEVWKNFNDEYEVSSYGRVRFISTGYIIKPSIGSENSVAQIAFGTRRGTYSFRVPELVAKVFLDPNAEVVYFKDGDIHNNHVSNLSLEPILPTEDGEIWVDVKGYEGRYKVSSYGKLFSLSRKEKRGSKTVTIQGRLLNLNLDQDGYQRVVLVKDGHTKDIFMHRLVAQSFIPNPQGLPTVNHIDGNKTNNHISNLEWCTNNDNIAHAVRTGLRDDVAKNNPRSYKVIVTGTLDIEFDSINQASKYFDVDPELLRLYIHGVYHTCKGLPAGIHIEAIKNSDNPEYWKRVSKQPSRGGNHGLNTKFFS